MLFRSKQDTLTGLVGALTAAAVTDPTASATLIALLKGLLKQLQGTGTGAAPVQLSGSIPEYGWVDGDAEPAPDSFAFGAKVDPATGAITTMYWNGIAWVEVV